MSKIIIICRFIRCDAMQYFLCRLKVQNRFCSRKKKIVRIDTKVFWSLTR